MILITGASGNVGGAVLAEVLKTGAPIRAMYRSRADAANAPAGVATAIADFADKESINRALAGVETVYLVCSPVRELVLLEGNAIEACQASGVKHVLLNSALGAGDYPKSFPAWHRQVEDKLRSSGLNYTILRPNSFMQNILAFNAPSIAATGAFYGAYGNARISYIDVRDIAAVAAKVLLAAIDYAGQTYELDGPEAVTCAELATRISHVARRQVQYVDLPEATQRESMLGMDMPEWQVDALLDLQRYYTNGQGGAVTNVLPDLLGRPPVQLNHFLEEFKDRFRSQAASA